MKRIKNWLFSPYHIKIDGVTIVEYYPIFKFFIGFKRYWDLLEFKVYFGFRKSVGERPIKDGYYYEYLIDISIDKYSIFYLINKLTGGKKEEHDYYFSYRTFAQTQKD